MSGAVPVLLHGRKADTPRERVTSSDALGAIVATGPWILTILALAAISLTTREDLELDTLAAFRTIVVYAFALSLVATAPITIISIRMTADLLHLGRTELLLGCFLASLLLGALLSAASFAVLALVSSVSPAGLAVVICSSVVGFVWIALALSTALRDYRGILMAFAGGLAVSAFVTVGVAQAGGSYVQMAYGFAVGLFVTMLLLCYRVLTEFRHPMRNILAPLQAFGHFGRTYKMLAIGATFVTAGVWVDKWIIWSGPEGEQALSGLVHAPTYDGAMFIAYLSIVPCLVLFVSILETSFTRNYRRYYLAISAHATLTTIERNARDLAVQTHRALLRTGRAQFIICLIFVMAAPNIVELAGLHYEDTGLLRVGAIGASFHFLFLASLSFLLFFERHTEFCLLGACQFTLNSIFTIATLLAGPDYYGLGYLAAAVISSLIAFAVVDRSIGQLTYFTFSRALGAARM
ncbi:exopolysaccharide Pel transporter PelG [Hyphomicrobium sp.]|uniref:exopolysaccharide Pel transporter PelG n=1 Tax=Hyphomicrobium sp. TaxID=82 RepID=UPI002E3477ED|nr:exopolysaccharide Pel transporter PelG [Hyphomicrobium sp.]HEX2839977.1 exopolysaccharide Pel transporter PelG [Hyphomicrobium sp.]